ncbi:MULTISPECIES: sulfur carrier protein ThiS [Deefgea]|uniref:Sulfur carrier protein ThiS n=1 Tax=Deefgea chitinilytica TaxID=570276 RepID=A0ABS2CBT5_9NEIS|nr:MULTISPECIES: sulfur carrier protein ThiS [Deefgea]MBM5571492.1 sulfur carrier protein ThiS [Deefgea chitinilytica]MBM9888725.1 sulfur carrier protein ThiS [Deefgea sp. CFH1-16]
MIKISINGEPREFPAPLSIAEMVGQLALTGKRIAIEQNGEIVPKSQYAHAMLQEGDVLEMVVAVGGG